MSRWANYKIGKRILVNDPLEFAAKRGKYVAGCSVDDFYNEEEQRYLKAVNEYKIKYGRQFPTACEYMAILESLGYKK